jgi:hypothetical protein
MIAQQFSEEEQLGSETAIASMVHAILGGGGGVGATLLGRELHGEAPLADLEAMMSWVSGQWATQAEV